MVFQDSQVRQDLRAPLEIEAILDQRDQMERRELPETGAHLDPMESLAIREMLVHLVW